MTKIELDDLWDKAFKQAQAEGEEYTRYHFAALVQAHEREQCAKVLDQNADVCFKGYFYAHLEAQLRANAAAIRARGNT